MPPTVSVNRLITNHDGTGLRLLTPRYGLIQQISRQNHRRPRRFMSFKLGVMDREEYRKALPAEWSHLPLKLRWLRPTLFFVGMSLSIYTTAAYLANVETDHYRRASTEPGVFETKNNDLLREERDRLNRESWLAAVDEVRTQSPSTDGWIFAAIRHPLLFLFANVKPEIFVVATTLPLAAAWCFPRMHTKLFRHWTHSFRSGKSYTSLTSLFSHQLPFQWINVFAAWAAVPITAAWFIHAPDRIIHESSPWFHMSAFCLSAGMFSFLAPQLLVYFRFRGAFRELARGIPAPYTNPKINKALLYYSGLSGTVHACITLSVCARPSTPVFKHKLNVPRGWLWAGVCATETVCWYICLGNVGWAANLCGVAFGALYSTVGPSFWIAMRTVVHRFQFPSAWRADESGAVRYPGKERSDAHPLFKRSFGDEMGWH